MRSEFISQRKVEDLTGQKINYWTVLETTDKIEKNAGAIHKCQCVCGKIKYLNTVQLRYGAQSCGCKNSPFSKDAKKFKIILKN